MQTTHHPISKTHFNAKTLRALAKAGLFLVGSTFVPDNKGSFENGETAYIMSNGSLFTYLQVLKAAK